MITTELLGLSFLHCHVLFSVAKHKNISKAAEELHMTQSTVTKIIQRTEETLHLQLFQRNNKGVLLTEDGAYILPVLNSAFQQVGAALDLLYQKKQHAKPRLCIALGNMLRGSSCFYPHIEAFQEKFPNTVLDLQGGEIWELRQRLIDDKLDIAIMPEFEKIVCQEHHLNWCTVQTGKMYIFHNIDHVKKNASTNTLSDFKDETFMIADRQLIKGYYDYALDCCRRAGFQPKSIISQQDQYAIEYMLRKDKAIILGDEFFQLTDNMPYVAATEIPNLTFSVIAIWKECNHNPAVAEFISLFTENGTE